MTVASSARVRLLVSFCHPAGPRRARAVLAALLLSTGAAPAALAFQDAGQLVVTADAPAADEMVAFESDRLSYDENSQEVVAEGKVVMAHQGVVLRADRIRWNRQTAEVEARGNVSIIDDDGNRFIAEAITLTDTLRDGAIENMKLLLEGGGRLAARDARRIGEVTEMRRAVYSPCEICDTDGDEKPLWRIRAVRVVHDGTNRRITYRGAYLDFLDVPVAYIPYIAHPDTSVARASGILVPQLRQSRALGFNVELPYYVALAPWRDLTLTPTLYTGERPALGIEYRERLRDGIATVAGSITYAARRDDFNEKTGEDYFRGHVFANAQLNHSPRLRSTAQINWTADDTYLRRYDITTDDRLRSFYRLERFGQTSYLRAQGWAFQGLRVGDSKGLTEPLVFPEVDWFYRPAVTVAGGALDVHVNAFALERTKGLDTRRVSVSGQWQGNYLNQVGHVITATALVRGDVYHVADASRPDNVVYAGRNGTNARLLPLAAIDWRWPLGGAGFGGYQTVEPIVTLVATPAGGNDGIPNEDSRAFDLDETNVFALNRFPGLDRWEGGVRLAYGGRWTLQRGAISIESLIGQSLRLSDQSAIFPDGTGLSGKFSDVVGRTTFGLGDRLDVIHRFRIDKGSLAVRRNEIDMVYNQDRWGVTLGYSRLNRNINIEDLDDREEIRLAGRYRLNRYWTITGSAIEDLTSGREPIRHRIGLVYEDECFVFGVTYRKNFTEDRDFRRGTTFLFNISLKTFGQ